MTLMNRLNEPSERTWGADFTCMYGRLIGPDASGYERGRIVYQSASGNLVCCKALLEAGRSPAQPIECGLRKLGHIVT